LPTEGIAADFIAGLPTCELHLHGAASVPDVLELCPTSNVRTRAVESLDDHPFPALTGADVRETVNSDDPGMFDTDVNREYDVAHEVFGLEPEGLVELARESVHASFAPHGVRERILEEIDAYASASIAGRETGRV
jgi:aminodeoxyfutalosine deaminase